MLLLQACCFFTGDVRGPPSFLFRGGKKKKIGTRLVPASQNKSVTSGANQPVDTTFGFRLRSLSLFSSPFRFLSLSLCLSLFLSSSLPLFLLPRSICLFQLHHNPNSVADTCHSFRNLDTLRWYYDRNDKRITLSIYCGNEVSLLSRPTEYFHFYWRWSKWAGIRRQTSPVSCQRLRNRALSRVTQITDSGAHLLAVIINCAFWACGWLQLMCGYDCDAKMKCRGAFLFSVQLIEETVLINWYPISWWAPINSQSWQWVRQVNCWPVIHVRASAWFTVKVYLGGRYGERTDRLVHCLSFASVGAISLSISCFSLLKMCLLSLTKTGWHWAGTQSPPSCCSLSSWNIPLEGANFINGELFLLEYVPRRRHRRNLFSQQGNSNSSKERMRFHHLTAVWLPRGYPIFLSIRLNDNLTVLFSFWIYFLMKGIFLSSWIKWGMRRCLTLREILISVIDGFVDVWISCVESGTFLMPLPTKSVGPLRWLESDGFEDDSSIARNSIWRVQDFSWLRLILREKKEREGILSSATSTKRPLLEGSTCGGHSSSHRSPQKQNPPMGKVAPTGYQGSSLL